MQSGAKLNKECPFIKINGEVYVRKDTLEMKFYKKSTTKADNKESVRQSLRRLRDLINANVTVPRNCKWITLTFSENMTDTKKLYKCLSLFHKRYNYHYTNKDEKIRYIDCIEPQGRGAFHAHILIIYDRKAPFVPCKDLAKLWGFGYVDVQNLNDIDNVGAYLTAYLGDMELDSAVELNLIDKDSIVKVDENNNKKRYVKGARLSLYPIGLHICRHSANCLKAEIAYKDKVDGEIYRLVNNFKPKYKYGYEIELDNGKLVKNTYYNFIIPPRERWKFDGGEKPKDYVDIIVGEHQLTFEETYPDCCEIECVCDSLFEDVSAMAFLDA